MGKRDNSEIAVTGAELLVLTRWQLVQLVRLATVETDSHELRRMVEEVKEMDPSPARTGRLCNPRRTEPAPRKSRIPV